MLGCKRNLVPTPRLLTTLVSIHLFLLFCRAILSNSNTSPPFSPFSSFPPSLPPPLLLFPHFPLWYSESVFFFSSRVRIKSINISTDISLDDHSLMLLINCSLRLRWDMQAIWAWYDDNIFIRFFLFCNVQTVVLIFSMAIYLLWLLSIYFFFPFLALHLNPITLQRNK